MQYFYSIFAESFPRGASPSRCPSKVLGTFLKNVSLSILDTIRQLSTTYRGEKCFYVT